MIGVPVVTGGTSEPMQTTCNSVNATRRVAVDVTDPDGVDTVVLRWTAPDGVVGEQPMTLTRGRWRATLGPFASAGDASYSIRATDAPGTSSSSPIRTLPVEPCPG